MRRNFHVKIFRERMHKPKVVFSIRLSEDDIEFLHTIRNASEFFHNAIQEEKKRQMMLEEKGINYEVVNEIAEAYVSDCITFLESKSENDPEWWVRTMQSTLFDIAKLTLQMPNPFPEMRDRCPILLSRPGTLDDMPQMLQSREAKAFIQNIRDNIEQPTDGRKPLTEDEIDAVGRIFEEAKLQLERRYRKEFHKLPPEDWYRYVIGDRSTGKRDYYQLP